MRLFSYSAVPAVERPRDPSRVVETKGIAYIRRAILAGGTALALSLGSLSAVALWGDRYDTPTPMFTVGSISFGVAPREVVPGLGVQAVGTKAIFPLVNNQFWAWNAVANRWEPQAVDFEATPIKTVSDLAGDGVTTAAHMLVSPSYGQPAFNMSTGGAPVELRIPGAFIAQVMNQTPEQPWVYWQFVVDGAAPESVGLLYDLAAVGQCPAGANSADCFHDGSIAADPYGVWNVDAQGQPAPTARPWDGRGSQNPDNAAGYTLLGYSKLLIYPAGDGGACPVPVDPKDRLTELLAAIETYKTLELLADRSDEDWDAAEGAFVDVYNLSYKLGLNYPTDFSHTDPTDTEYPVYLGGRDFDNPNVFVYNAGWSYDHHWNLDNDRYAVLNSQTNTGFGSYKYLSHTHSHDTGLNFYDGNDDEVEGSHISVEDVWCVAAHFANDPDLPYTQSAWIMGYDSANGNPYSGNQSWGATVQFPPSLPMLGDYYNVFEASGIGDDNSLSSDNYVWRVNVYPDPAEEPDVVLLLDPIVDHIDFEYYTPCDSRPYPSPYYASEPTCNYLKTAGG